MGEEIPLERLYDTISPAIDVDNLVNPRTLTLTDPELAHISGQVRSEPLRGGGVLGKFNLDSNCADFHENKAERNTRVESEPTLRRATKPVPTHSNNNWRYYLHVFFIVSILVIQSVLLLLGCFTFWRAESIILSSSPSTVSPHSPKTIHELFDDFEEFKEKLEALINNNNACASIHNATLDFISAELDILSEMVDDLTVSSTPAPPSTELVDIYGTCTRLEYSCLTIDVLSSVNFTSCITPRFHQSQVEVPNYITNLQCIVTVDYNFIAPISSTLVVEERDHSNKAWLCRCMGIIILTHNSLIPVEPFECVMEITMCPKTIPFSLK